MAVAQGEGMSASPANGTDASLRQALDVCVPELHRLCADSWVVIGSAAAWLAGAPVTIADIDVLTSARDAQVLADRWRQRRMPTAPATDDDRFRSHFARFAFPGLEVEVMGDLEVRDERGWRRAEINEVRIARIAGHDVPIPSVPEQIRLLRQFGRGKDLERAALLAAVEKRT